MSTCRQCGKVMEQGTMGYYCSDGCRRAAELQEKQLQAQREEDARRRREEFLREMKEKGKKTLEKWEKGLDKEVQKRKDRMAKLKVAIQGDDPYAIVKAIKGGIFKRFFRLIWQALKAIPFIIGIICIIRFAIWFYNGVSTSYEYSQSPKAMEASNVIQTETNATEQQAISNAVPTEVSVPAVEQGAESMNN